jgi:uncharacterized protein YbjT (DUF2867 family)
MRQKTYVVTGASGHVGQAVVESLQARGHRTREVSRRAGVSIDDAGALTRAFSEADGAFVMIPFDMKARDLHEREQEMGMRLAAAVRAGGVPRVVLLSGTSAHLGRNAGSGLGAAMMEERLNDLGIAELVCLRGCFFMENFLNLGIVEQAKIGVFGTMFRGDVATPMVAARDVGARAAALLTGVPFHEPRVREILGARDYTMAEATKILGSAIGHPELTYVQVSYDDARRHMLGGGLSPSFIDAVVETARSFNAGMIWAREERSAANTTETTLERWARDAFGDDEVDAGRRQGRGVDGGVARDRSRGMSISSRPVD